MTDQTSPAATWDVTASVTVTSEIDAHRTRHAFTDAVNDTVGTSGITHVSVEMTASTDTVNAGAYGEAVAKAVADELDRREQAACDQAAAEFDTVWDSVGGRPVEVAGSPENLAALDRLLTGWRCCAAPASCGATCQDDEISDVLARAARLVSEKTAAPAPAASEEPTR